MMMTKTIHNDVHEPLNGDSMSLKALTANIKYRLSTECSLCLLEPTEADGTPRQTGVSDSDFERSRSTSEYKLSICSQR